MDYHGILFNDQREYGEDREGGITAMTIEIHYFSGTGNSLVVARDLANPALSRSARLLFLKIHRLL